MKTNNQIVEEIVRDPKFFDIVKKVTKGNELAQDLFQEVCLILLEYDNEKLNNIIEQKYFNFFFVRILNNQFNSSTSPFYKMYKKEYDKYIDANKDLTIDWDEDNSGEIELSDVDLPDEETDESWGESIRAKYEGIKSELYWYDAELFELYIRLGSYRKVSKETGIPLRSVGTNLKKTKEFLVKRFNEIDKHNNREVK